MNTIRRCILLVTAALAVTGCHRDLPEGVSQQSLKALVNMADEAVKQCDALLDTPDCLTAEGYLGDPNRVLVLNTAFFSDIPELRFLGASCGSVIDQTTLNRYCETLGLDRGIDRSDECEKDMVDFGSWPRLDHHKAGIGVYTVNPQCKTPMSIVIVQRKSPKGRMLGLHAIFINKKWLATHPTDHLKPRPLPKRRDWPPRER